jgi:hypothetical protein
LRRPFFSKTLADYHGIQTQEFALQMISPLAYMVRICRRALELMKLGPDEWVKWAMVVRR